MGRESNSVWNRRPIGASNRKFLNLPCPGRQPRWMQGRLQYIDAMRGIAALLVVLQHALAEAFPASPLLEYVSPGRFGVVLFFLISGFVVPFSIKGERPIASFVVNRAARLLPALWLSIGTLLIVKGPVGPGEIAASFFCTLGPA